MGGSRMNAVKASLQIMLRSLPSRDTTFNIVSFGSRYSSLWPTSQAYSAESVKEASKHVDTFQANYGGTELRSALQFAFNSRVSAKSPKDTTPTAVFVLTDGEAWDLDGVLSEISTTVKAAKEKDSLLRTFVLGVGNEVSTAMCEGIARAGKGTAVYVAVSRTRKYFIHLILTIHLGGREAGFKAYGTFKGRSRWSYRRSRRRMGFWKQ
jgi:Mg-chelatase subunit ChlD